MKVVWSKIGGLHDNFILNDGIFLTKILFTDEMYHLRIISKLIFKYILFLTQKRVNASG